MNAIGDPPGLFLRIGLSDARSWVLRITLPDGRRADMGLGGADKVSLAEAREAAREAHAKVRAGVDPIAEREAARLKAGGRARRRGEAAEGLVTVQVATERYYAINQAGWSDKHRANWWNSLEQHAFPIIGDLPVADATIEDVLKVLKPIWTTKTKTATHVRARLEAVFGWSITSKHRTAPNPAIWVHQLANLLPKPGAVTKVIHHAALPYEDAPALYQALRSDPRPAAQALALVMLTASRSNEVRGMEWPELGLNTGIWTLPPARAKSRRTHRVPLSGEAVKLLEAAAPEENRTGLIFVAPVSGRALGDVSLADPMRQLGYPKEVATVHGMRATFRSWIAEQHREWEDLAEVQLQHQKQSATERAYLRSDYLAERRTMMQAWADYLAAPVKKAEVKVEVEEVAG